MSIEDLEGIKKERVNLSLITLSNAVELGTQIVRGLNVEGLDHDINGTSITNAQISNLLQSKIKEIVNTAKVEVRGA